MNNMSSSCLPIPSKIVRGQLSSENKQDGVKPSSNTSHHEEISAKYVDLFTTLFIFGDQLLTEWLMCVHTATRCVRLPVRETRIVTARWRRNK